MGILYIVPTPIGNLKDITIRALEVLFSVDLIACEDTRRTGLLLQKLGEMKSESTGLVQKTEHPPLISYYEQNEFQRIPEIISYLQMGKNIALISDAGTPAISDPGFKLIREAIKEKIKIESLPGASAPLVALTASGLPTDKFTFAGYPPRKPGHRKTFFENIKSSQEFLKTTVILFEAPHKLLKTLAEMQEVFGDIDIVIARELTKTHEELRHEKISASLSHFKKKEPKGEIVVLFNLNI
ncbi:MAG TPA: 16S rRNA (cytidine(1402)-2'-O)-methyltransferase [Candidatus Saccharimonadales bacterium]|nr:16S rRNA (cytidine(1402)-2'-O)-methyltransferase [Candidatus Saccharimonadales bacterium]